jgi:hypothetical protein
MLVSFIGIDGIGSPDSIIANPYMHEINKSISIVANILHLTHKLNDNILLFSA